MKMLIPSKFTCCHDFDSCMSVHAHHAVAKEYILWRVTSKCIDPIDAF